MPTSLDEVTIQLPCAVIVNHGRRLSVGVQGSDSQENVVEPY